VILAPKLVLLVAQVALLMDMCDSFDRLMWENACLGSFFSISNVDACAQEPGS